ncbi:TlyA family RNA methyltransferase [Mobiluncus mulieris]|uniref:TlyA family RNA methyltransferase n=1 Tax=Mobiluncus mulieris TaxID=2052 RepID=A0A7Y0U312_9ACTO|nr:TlyA family RNA methyltransferase [Mobiluncus mulieris]NMW66056.1 TlyA family RNA methyltransferase [Mobiluncus mulieris]
MKRARLDTELVRRHLAASRTQAAAMIQAGRVLVDGQTAMKPARQVELAAAIVLRDPDTVTYASRGAHKLLGALDYLELYGPGLPSIEGKICLDAGASTGGFTDVLLRRGAAKVFAVDVGYGQLSWRLRTDSRVVNLERTNVRTLDAALIDPPADLVVGDLSFISLELVLPALTAATRETAWYLVMVKPQFEIGRERLGHGGVVRDVNQRIETVLGVAGAAQKLGMGIAQVAPSGLAGPAGNVEYFLYFARQNLVEHPLESEELVQACRKAVERGPKS